MLDVKQILKELASPATQDHRKSLVDLVDVIRPDRLRDQSHAEDQVQNLLAHLSASPELLSSARQALAGLFRDLDGIEMLTQSGFAGRMSFIQAIARRIQQRILPPVLADQDVRQLLREIFHKKHDYRWLSGIKQETWSALFSLLELPALLSETAVRLNLLHAARLLSEQISSLGIDPAIARKTPELNRTASPFLQQNTALILATSPSQEQPKLSWLDLETVRTQIDECKSVLKELHTRRQEIGTSLQLIYAAQSLDKDVRRLELILRMAAPLNEDDLLEAALNCFLDVVRVENTRLSIRNYASEQLETLAYEVVEHAASRGGKYIASNLKEYVQYFRAAALGGILIATFALFKVLLSTWQLSPLGQGLVDSLNYAFCFILVYMTGGIIATKQPAMTASAIARCMDRTDDGKIDDIQGLKETIIRVSRSQFISLVGNLALAFPLALMVSWLVMGPVLGILISSEKAQFLFQEVNPSGPALIFAAIAGVFLSFSGLISGFVDNKIIFHRVVLRIAKHPFLLKFFPKSRHNIAQYLGKHLGALAGNAALGFFLGMAGTIGFLIGLPFDIRHVAFSSANVGMAIGSQGLVIDHSILITAFLGVLLIGLVNFMVSFALTLFIAMKSRQVTFGQGRALLYMLLFRLVRTPLDYFFPPELWRLGTYFKKQKTILPTIKNQAL